MKRITVLLVIIPLMLSLSGCWDVKIFEQIGFILNMGVESSKDGELMVTYTSPVITEAKQPREVELIVVKGAILRDARTDARRRSARYLEAGKIQQILISAELAQKRSVHELIEVIERDPIDPAQAWVVIVDGSPNELLKGAIKSKDEPRPSIYVNGLLNDCSDNSYIPRTKVYNFDIGYFAPGIDPIAPLVKLSGEHILVTGSALFSEDKMVGKIDHRQTFLVLAMMGKAGRTQFMSIDPVARELYAGSKKKMATTLKHNRSKVKVKIVSGKPVVDISLAFEGYIEEYVFDRLTEESVQKRIEKGMEENIEKDAAEVVKYLQQVNCDPIGIGDIIRAKHNKYWKTIDWKEIYRDASINIDVKVDIKQFGVVD